MTEVQVRAIDLFSRHYDYGRGAAHARKVADLAASIFDQLRHLGLLPGVPASARNVLYAAGLAHDVGLSERARLEVGILPSWTEVSGYDRARITSFQALRLLLDNPPPPLQSSGVTREDRCGLLYLTLWDGAAAPREVPDEPLVCGEVLRTLAGILRIADCLDFRINCLVSRLRILTTESWVRIIVNSMGKVTEEVTCASASSDLLAASLNRRVFIQQVIRE